MDIPIPKILETLNENFIDELERLEKLNAVRSRPGFKELIALMVVLTSGCPEGDPESETVITKRWLGYYNRMCTIFTSVTCIKETIESKNNFGKPLIRHIECASDEPAASIPSGPSGRDACMSQYLWKLMDSVVVEVPDSYCQGFSAALLYLVAMDAGTSFQSLRAGEALEIPCLLEIFRHSSRNNANNVCSLFGEYLSLLRVCRFENYSGEQYWYQCQTTTFDFSIMKDYRTVKYFSVKTVGRTGFIGSSCFSDTINQGTLDCETRFVNGEDKANIFIHDCCCEVCLQHPVRKICLGAEQDFLEELKKLSCSANQMMENVLGAVQLEMINQQAGKVEVYLVSGRVVYELRRALFGLHQEQFRGYKFKLRDFLAKNLGGQAHRNNPDTSNRMETLRGL